MKLKDYLDSEGALSVGELRLAIRAKSDVQIRQWQHGYAGRIPSPENCVAIQVATNGAVMRWDLRPDDWNRIWPELIGTKGAPPVPEQSAPAHPAPAAEPVAQS
jgi:DNA-binding transcriptional regulator YdaS (Cro superfamily)